MSASSSLKSELITTIFVAILLLAWEALARFLGFSHLLFPPPEAVAVRLWELLADGEAIMDTFATLGRMTVGYAVAIVIAVPLGLIMGRSRLVDDLFGPLFNFILPIPILAVVPLIILWFGLTFFAYLLLVAFASVPPIVVNAASGSRNIDPLLLRVADSMNVTGARLFFKVVLPAALPAVLVGLRQGLAMAWRAAIGAEFFSVAANGLGVRMFVAKDYVQSDVVLSLLIVIMAVSMFLDKLVFAPIEARTIRRWTGNER